MDMIRKRDSIPLVPCILPSSTNIKPSLSDRQCPSRLSQLALPNLCVVMAVLQDHYKKLNDKQKQTLQSLIVKIETETKRRNFSVLKKETKMIKPPAAAAAAITKKGVAMKNELGNKNMSKITSKEKINNFLGVSEKGNKNNKKLFEKPNEQIEIQDKKPIKKIKKRKPFIYNKPILEKIKYKENKNVCDENKTEIELNGLKVIKDDENKIVKQIWKRQIDLLPQNFALRKNFYILKLSHYETEILHAILKLDLKQCKIYLLFDLIYDRNEKIVIKTKYNKFRINIKQLLFKLSAYMALANLQLEQILRCVTYETLANLSRYLKIYPWTFAPQIIYKLCLHIDGHPKNSNTNYISLMMYNYWQNQLFENLALYEQFKMECLKPMMAKNCFYLYGAYHVWQKYSEYYTMIVKEILPKFHKQYVTVCSQCFKIKDDFKEVMNTHQVPHVLMKAIETSAFWRESLLETIACVKRAQITQT